MKIGRGFDSMGEMKIFGESLNWELHLLLCNGEII
jgi:hypothetical protein